MKASGLINAWYPIALSAVLRKEAISRRAFGIPLVLFRDARGLPVALEDRCPHRNVALSLGTTENGTLRCAYHGWRFDSSGACVEAPCAGPGEALPQARAQRFAATERDGTVWVYLGDRAAPPEPAWNLPVGERYAGFELLRLMRCPVEHVLANFVDCGHTGFVHAGLFRERPSRTVQAEMEETATGVRIETKGESDSKSVLARLLVRQGERIQHVDEFIAPHTVRVDYRMGRTHVVTTSICTPEDAQHTQVYTRVSLRVPLVSRLLIPVMKRLTAKILEQDRQILESQGRTLAHFERERFTSMEADSPTVWVAQSLKRFERGATVTPRRATVTYTL